MSIIIVVLSKIEDAKKIRRILVEHGFTNTIFCPTGAATLMELNKYSSGLIISRYVLPGAFRKSSEIL